MDADDPGTREPSPPGRMGALVRLWREGLKHLPLPGPRGARRQLPGKILKRAPEILALAGFGVMVLFPLLEAGARSFSDWVAPSSRAWVQHLTLWMGLFGAVLASAQGKHLSIAVGGALESVRFKKKLEIVGRGGAMGILACLTYASWVLVESQRLSSETLGGWLPTWFAMAAMPVGFGFMAWATFWRGGEGWRTRGALVGLALVVGPLVALVPAGSGAPLALVGVGVLIVLAAIGMPLYAVLGGGALLLFYAAWGPVAAVPAEAYRIVTNRDLPSIPLFALAGVVLARGGAPERLVGLVRGWTGWIPGGMCIATILACAFFTALTGASGVTILALGGLFFPILLAAKHRESFSLGLLTASGSVGLLFFPSLPVIMYAVYGRVAIDQLFVAAFLPGVLLLVLLGVFCVTSGQADRESRTAFDLREAAGATWKAKGDLVLPVLIVVGYFGGFMTILEVAALTAFWAILLETVLLRSLPFRAGLLPALVETAVLVGALIAVIGMAMGFINYLNDQMVPVQAADWVTSVIESKWVFLIALNLLLLLVGAMMDIYSAIVVVVPLIIPMAAAYGIHPAHLGVVFLANLELGYLTPPVGMNLFLSSLTFDRPLLNVWRAALPFLGLFAFWVLVVTYLPWISVGFMEWVTGGGPSQDRPPFLVP